MRLILIFMCEVGLLMVHYEPSALSCSRQNEALPISSSSNKIIAFEGMPGAGKTTLLSTLAEELEGTCILLPEINLEPHSPEASFPIEKQRHIFHQRWIERMHLLKNTRNLGVCFLLDRSHFSNLAFLYALDVISNTRNYQTYKDSIRNTFPSHILDLIIVLDISPDIGLERRRARGDKIPWPWSNFSFLKAVRQFYKEELPKIFSGNIKYIKAEKEKKEVRSEINEQLKEMIKNKNRSLTAHLKTSNKQINALFDFASDNNLGTANTRLINVLGVPTIYFLKHSIQLEKGHPVFFNNAQLHNLLYRNNLLEKVMH